MTSVITHVTLDCVGCRAVVRAEFESLDDALRAVSEWGVKHHSHGR